MKQHLLLFALLFASIVLKAQTVVVLELPDPCPTEVKENQIEKQNLTIAPNPVGDELMLQFNETESVGLFDIAITDTRGVVVMKVRQNAVGLSAQPMRLNVSHLPVGLYFMNVRTEKSTYVHKIIKK